MISFDSWILLFLGLIFILLIWSKIMQQTMMETIKEIKEILTSLIMVEEE